MKKILSLFVCFSVLLCGINVFAYELPKAFWAPNTKYENAVNTNNYWDIVQYGTQALDAVAGEPDNEQIRNVRVMRYEKVGSAYATLGDFDNSARVFNDLYNYAKQFDLYDYSATVAKAKANQYATAFDMYTDNGAYKYYGAKNEKQNGVLFGLCFDGATRNELKNESMVLVYQGLNESISNYMRITIKQASDSGLAVEYALNCTNQADDIRNIRSYTSQLAEISDLLNQYSNMPIYLRFGAEFDIWGNAADANSFIDAYRYVSDYFKSRNKNVAMVWSPYQTSRGDIDIEDYYPGDSYVDWVGMSSYAMQYFRGERGHKEEDEIVNKTGINADPVIAVKNIVDKFGDRKPIMLAESGCSHTVKSLGENQTDFAVNVLKKYYSYLPMVYPQIKLIAYFDHYVVGEPNDYSLSVCDRLKSEYIKQTQGARFIQDSYSNNSSLCYRKMHDGIYLKDVFPVSSYVHMYGEETASVSYYVDGKYVARADEIPFTVYINGADYSYGQHTLEAVATSFNGKLATTKKIVNISDSGSSISVKVSDNKVDFDQAPVLFNDRTMVPMRKIFEKLGASVTWDNATQTATGVRKGITVKITVGSNIMQVNSKKVYLDSAAIILSDRTLVPARAIAESLGCNVSWDDASQTVSITP